MSRSFYSTFIHCCRFSLSRPCFSPFPSNIVLTPASQAGRICRAACSSNRKSLLLATPASTSTGLLILGELLLIAALRSRAYSRVQGSLPPIIPVAGRTDDCISPLHLQLVTTYYRQLRGHRAVTALPSTLPVVSPPYQASTCCLRYPTREASAVKIDPGTDLLEATSPSATPLRRLHEHLAPLPMASRALSPCSRIRSTTPTSAAGQRSCQQWHLRILPNIYLQD